MRGANETDEHKGDDKAGVGAADAAEAIDVGGEVTKAVDGAGADATDVNGSATNSTDMPPPTLATKPHPYCRTDANARTSLYFSRLRSWFRDRLIAWVTVSGSSPPHVARESTEGGHHSGYLVYDSVYDAELILATWETAIGVQFLDLRLAPDFPPPMELLPQPASAVPTVVPDPDGVPHRPPSRVYGAPYFSQPYAATTPRRITAREPAEQRATEHRDEVEETQNGRNENDGTDAPMDAQAVFRAMRVWGPVRTISIVAAPEVPEVPDIPDIPDIPGDTSAGDFGARIPELAGDPGPEPLEGGYEPEPQGTKRTLGPSEGADDSPRKKHRGAKAQWSVDVGFWYEEDAERLQREWDGVLGGWRADVSVPEWWGGLPDWAGHAPCTPYCRPPTPVTS